MARGGKRPGAGRKRGTRNRKTQEQADAIIASGLTPLDYMLSVMRDTGNEPAVRLSAAKDAAPYVHARLAAIEHSGKEGGPIELVLKGSDING